MRSWDLHLVMVINTVSCQVVYGLSGCHGYHDLSYSYSMNCMRKMAIFLFSSITAHLSTGSQYIWPTEENSCSLFSQHQLTNAQMLHSDIRHWGKNILLLQKKHMMTKLSGCHTGFCAGGGKHWCTWPVSFWKPTLLWWACLCESVYLILTCALSHNSSL